MSAVNRCTREGSLNAGASGVKKTDWEVKPPGVSLAASRVDPDIFFLLHLLAVAVGFLREWSPSVRDQG